MPTRTPSDVASLDLPVQLTSFIGRDREIARLRETLATSRLLTLTGAGGSGKTRLALEVAGQMAAEYEEGVAWVELAALSDSARLAHHVAATLGVRDETGRAAVDALVQALRSRSLLLVLDNCEHLADACAELADALLRGCPQLTILATSREALGVGGERAWLVPPLSLPAGSDEASADRLLDSEAVRLFVTRAQDVVPSFALHERNAAAVVQICRRLDGLPLAIELAAARVRVLAPEQIAERLGNAFALLSSGNRTALPRHRALRTTIDWSYRLLSEAEQLLLQRLSVFVGGFTLEAAEAVCADERLEAREVLDQLTRLVDRSLVVMRENEGVARYDLLETVRQYAAERLSRAPDAGATRERHAEFYLAFAEFAEPHLYMGGTDRRWLERIDVEIGNVRAAAEWFDGDDAGAEPALRLVTSLRWYWYQRDMAEGRRQLERTLARGAERFPLARGRALLALGAIAFWQGDIASMHAPLADAIGLGRALADDALLTEALNWQALGSAHTGDLTAAWAGIQQALTLARRIGGPLLVQTVSTAGHIAHRRGQLDTERELHAEATQRARALGLGWAVATISTNVARLAYTRGDLDGAAAHWCNGLGLDLDLRERWVAPISIEGLALVAFARGAAHDAARLLGAAESVRQRLGMMLRPFDETDRPVLERLRASLGEATFEAAFAEGRALSMAQAIEYAAAGAGAAGAVGIETSAAAAAAPHGAAATVSDDATGASATPPALRVLALGPLEIRRDGEPLPADAWPYAKPKELLIFLLSHPEGRTREQIGLAFWPESSAAQVKNSFHVTLHHLRKALGHADWIGFENQRYRITPDLPVEFDAARFEQQVTVALRDARAGSGSTDALRGALAHYRGDFLQDETVGDWHLEIRARLGRLFVEGLFALGERLMEAGEYAEAAAVYQQLVRKEDLHEEAHRRLMLCWSKVGERTRALKHYEHLVALLHAELDAGPEQETITVYERLKASPQTSQPA